MLEFLAHLFSSQGFEPHGHCYLWLPEILWLHVISDAFIALAYYSIYPVGFWITSLAFGLYVLVRLARLRPLVPRTA